MRRIPKKAVPTPKGKVKYCTTCLYPKAVMTYGNRAQARQAAKAKNPKATDDLALCTNSDGSVHIANPLVVIRDE